MELITSVQASQTPVEEEIKGKVKKKSGNRVGYNYIILKSYKESQKNDVVKCLFIKSLSNFGFCVIKEGSYGDSKDKHGRDIIDRLKWQQQLHQDLQDKIRIPRLLGNFEERGNYYLVIEHIKGTALAKVWQKYRKDLRNALINGQKLGLKFLDYLIQICDLLSTLHAQQIVHRDATPNNYMITSGGRVAIIDLEMCYSLKQQFPTPAFQLGTYGYMSKQQEATMVPTTAEDIFALGAIILMMWSGVAPGKLTNESEEVLKDKISFFISDQQIANLVIQCLLPEDHLRPNANEIGRVLSQFKGDIKYKVSRPSFQTVPFTWQQILTTVQESISTLATPLLADADKGWFSNDLKPAPAEDKHKLRKQWYASYNCGVSGVIYYLARAKQVGMDTEMTLPFVEKGLDLVTQKYISRIEYAKASLHFGSEGIAAVIASAIEAGLIEATHEHLEWIDLLLQKESVSRDVFRGVAGQGIANIICKTFLSPDRLDDRLKGFAEKLINEQEHDGSWTKGYYRRNFMKIKKKKVVYSFSEGMAGIIYFLLEYGHRSGHEASINSAHRGLKWLISKAKRKKDIVEWRTVKGKELKYDWADGTAGVALTFIKAYELTGNAIYRQYGIGTLLHIPPRITDSNIGQRSGLAGIGEVYLEAFRIFKEDTWYQRAGWIAQVIMQLKKRHAKHGIYWLVENEREPVANFMIGNAGVMHFLLRYCYPGKIGFPMMPE